MTPRHTPLTNVQKGIERIFTERDLNYELFKLEVDAGNDNSSIGRVLSKEKEKRTGINPNITGRTIKRYRGML